MPVSQRADMSNVRPTSNGTAQKSRWDPRPHDDDASIKTYDFAYLTGVPDPTFISQVIAAIKTIVTPLIAQPLLLRTVTLIFGGCCSNVYTLESILNLSSSTGTLITFLQFVFITLYTLPTQLTFHLVSPPEPPPLQPVQTVWLPRLRRRKVPLRTWMLYAAQFALINILNNAAFGYKISLPLHIILRSAGPVASMLLGYLWTGKRYSSRKVFSVALLFLGVVLAATSDAGSNPSAAPSSSATSCANVTTSIPSAQGGIVGLHYAIANTSQESPINTTTPISVSDPPTSTLLDQAPGFVLLTLALLLSAIMGIWSDSIYTRYGRSIAIANEQLFYGHLLSLPVFALRYADLTSQWTTLMTASDIAFPRPSYQADTRRDLTGLPPMAKLLHMMHRSAPPTWQAKATAYIGINQLPRAVTYLLLNSITQIACISGVHGLSTQTSALTVSIVLNVRKVVSLLLSIWLFGNELAVGVAVGAVVVFVGGGIYGMPDGKSRLGEENMENVVRRERARLERERERERVEEKAMGMSESKKDR